jgi:hypothetical protein
MEMADEYGLNRMGENDDNDNDNEDDEEEDDNDGGDKAAPPAIAHPLLLCHLLLPLR